MEKNGNGLFLYSALTEMNPFISTKEVKEWLKRRNEQVHVKVSRIPFAKLENWLFTDGVLKHSSGSFFSIDGINVKTNSGYIQEWDQPIINQPEIGFLGIICQEIDGILYFLMQAKIEPGNVNHVQLSPTLQATKSNYTQVHKGKKPLYLEYFVNLDSYTVLLDQLQSEQGARFLKKRNRNIILKVNDPIEKHDDFVWLTLGQIKKLMEEDNLVNMDTRTVISGIPFEKDYGLLNKSDFYKSLITEEHYFHSFDSIISWFTQLKFQQELEVSKKPLSKLNGWKIGEFEISHIENKFFNIIATKVEISSREVTSWSQPLVMPAQEGLIAFIIREINGVMHFLMQAKLEAGNFDILEFAPTVQCLTGNYRETVEGTLPYLDYVLKVPEKQILYKAYQSEEGGRFYREQNLNLIIKVDSSFPIEVEKNYCWMTLGQLSTFIKFNNYLNIQARSLIAAINF